MNSQANTIQCNRYKILFSQIQCKISINDSCQFGIVIRIGKTSSKYTQKKQIHQSIIKFDNILQVPIEERLLTQQNNKKQKCEIMLYKFKLNRQKQCKELVGMASLSITHEMFDEQYKKLRLTNSFDKEANVQCRMKIELGQADVLLHNESKLSSFYLKSQSGNSNNVLNESNKKLILSKQQQQTKLTNKKQQQTKSTDINSQNLNNQKQSILNEPNILCKQQQMQIVKKQQIKYGQNVQKASNQSKKTSQTEIKQKTQTQNIIRKGSQTQTKQNHVKIGLIKSNSKKSLRQNNQQQLNKNDNSFLLLLNGTDTQFCPQTPQIQKQLRHSQSQSSLLIENQQLKQLAQSKELSARKNLQNILNSQNKLPQSNKLIEQNKLALICQLLQEENKLLAAKVQSLQNKMLNQSVISYKSNASQNPNPSIPRPNSKKSPMIKKNTAITITPSFSRLQPQQSILPPQIITPTAQQSRIKSKKKADFQQGGSIKSQSRVIISQQVTQQQQGSPYFSKKNSDVVRQSAKLSLHQNERPNNLHLTFAHSGKLTQRTNNLIITRVIEATYNPPLNTAHYETGSNDRSIIPSSISEAQRNANRTYTKFSGKRKYQIVGAVKSPDNSQINMSGFGQQGQSAVKDGRSIILKKPSLQLNRDVDKSFDLNKIKQAPFNGIRIIQSNNQKPFLDFLKDKQENAFSKVGKQAAAVGATPNLYSIKVAQKNCQQLKPEAKVLRRYQSRITLQELDIKTQQMYRRNQRDLKQGNRRLLEQNKTLKKQKNLLSAQLQQKRQLSKQQFQKLKDQIIQLKNIIDLSKKKKDQHDDKYKDLLKKFTSLEEQNSKLKKDIKQQKTKYQYYFKMSNITDDKEKQKDPYVAPSLTSSSLSRKSSIKAMVDHDNSRDNSKTKKIQSSATSIRNIQYVEDGPKASLFDTKSAKKVQFSTEKDKQLMINNDVSFKQMQKSKAQLQRQGSSSAITKLKLHLKPTVPKSSNGSISGNFIQMMKNGSDTIPASNGTGMFGTLIANKQESIKEMQKAVNFFSKK